MAVSATVFPDPTFDSDGGTIQVKTYRRTYRVGAYATPADVNLEIGDYLPATGEPFASDAAEITESWIDTVRDGKGGANVRVVRAVGTVYQYES